METVRVRTHHTKINLFLNGRVLWRKHMNDSVSLALHTLHSVPHHDYDSDFILLPDTECWTQVHANYYLHRGDAISMHRPFSLLVLVLVAIFFVPFNCCFTILPAFLWNQNVYSCMCLHVICTRIWLHGVYEMSVSVCVGWLYVSVCLCVYAWSLWFVWLRKCAIFFGVLYLYYVFSCQK